MLENFPITPTTLATVYHLLTPEKKVINMAEDPFQFSPIVEEFLNLPQANKDDLPSSRAETLFPLVFGEDASIQTDPNFTKWSMTTW